MKNVIITGASGGIGAAAAKLFADAGYNVAAVSRSGKTEVGTPICADVSTEDGVEKMIEQAHAAMGGIDILINNAGIALPQDVAANVSETDYQRVFDTNMKSVHLCTNAVLPDMLQKQDGCIINVSSIWGVCGASCEAIYAASKAAVIGYTKSMAKELGLSGIRVNCVAPGFIDTPMNSRLSDADKAEFAQQTALNRIGAPKEVAQAFLFLAQATYITGQTICVDGGYLI